MLRIVLSFLAVAALLTWHAPARASPDMPAAKTAVRATEPLKRRQLVRRAVRPRAALLVPAILRKGGGFYSADMLYQVRGRLYASDADEFYSEEGQASWYGPGFHGKRTANGEVYDMFALTAAHKTLPLPSIARVTNLDNGRTILVRVNDRGPFIGDRIIDLSHASAQALGTLTGGVGRVQVDYVGVAPLDGRDDAERAHLASQSWAAGIALAPTLEAKAVASAEVTTPNVATVRSVIYKTTIGKLVLAPPRNTAPRAARTASAPAALRDACWTCRDADRP